MTGFSLFISKVHNLTSDEIQQYKKSFTKDELSNIEQLQLNFQNVLYSYYFTKVCLSKVINCPIGQITVKRKKLYKPVLQQHGEKKYDFNVSHDFNLFVLSCMEADLNSIGIDLAYTKLKSDKRSPTDFLDNMKSTMTVKEWNFIKHVNSIDQMLYRYFLLWTIKESFLKCVGCGLSFEIGKLEINIPNETMLMHCTEKIVYTTDSLKVYHLENWEQIRIFSLFQESFEIDNYKILPGMQNYTFSVYRITDENTGNYWVTICKRGLHQNHDCSVINFI